MTHLAEHVVTGAKRRSPPRRRATPRHFIRCRDRRWPALAAALAALSAGHRRSVRIVDADCGAGTMLMCAARYARALGFTAIEAHGIDDAPTLVARARAVAATVRDPAICLSFATGDLIGALEPELDFPADIVVWHGCRAGDVGVARAVAAAGRTLIADPRAMPRAAA